jgi:hypothetical protein
MPNGGEIVDLSDLTIDFPRFFVSGTRFISTPCMVILLKDNLMFTPGYLDSMLAPPRAYSSTSRDTVGPFLDGNQQDRSRRKGVNAGRRVGTIMCF